MTNISISEEIATACPDLHVLALSCDVCNSEPDERLWQEIADEEKAVRETVKLEQINKWLPIQATRQAYKVWEKIRIVIVLLLKPCGGAFP